MRLPGRKNSGVYDKDEKPQSSAEFVEDANISPAEIEAYNVDEKKLLRKV